MTANPKSIASEFLQNTAPDKIEATAKRLVADDAIYITLNFDNPDLWRSATTVSAARSDTSALTQSTVLDRVSDLLCGCAKACNVHGHEHGRAWTAPVPASDLKPFWGALGCSCFL